MSAGMQRRSRPGHKQGDSLDSMEVP
jgi:hypothetical protein